MQALIFLPSDGGVVVQDHILQGIVDLQRAVVVDEPELAEFVHESAHA